MTKKQISILIVDDHQMVRDGIETMLTANICDVNYIIDQSGMSNDALEKVKNKNYDVILLDYNLTGLNGAEIAKRMLAINPDLKILAISGYDEYAYIKNMIDAGVRGYLLKDIGPTELKKAIETVLNGETYYSHSVIPKLRAPFKSANNSTLLPTHKDHHSKRTSNTIIPKGLYLTDQEKNIVKLLAVKKSYDEIAKELNISKRTVESHRYNMLNKLNVKNTASLVKYANELGFI